MAVLHGRERKPPGRVVDLATGLISSVAGDGAVAFSGDGGDALSASLNYPSA